MNADTGKTSKQPSFLCLLASVIATILAASQIQSPTPIGLPIFRGLLFLAAGSSILTLVLGFFSSQKWIAKAFVWSCRAAFLAVAGLILGEPILIFLDLE